ncbi:phage major capsid protein [Paraburkholderia dipogonis]|uniref:phage major capsid protein n=1 Tax=Paraburkholderia dipogonis TaxID=1211383 RepID=UPI0038BB6A11
MDMTEIKRALEETFGAVKDAQNKSADEIRAELKALADKIQGQDVSLIDLGQKLAGLSENGRRETRADSIGEYFVKSDAFKGIQGGNSNSARARVTLEGDQLKAVAPIYESIDPNQFPVPSQYIPTIRGPGVNTIWVRDMLPQGQTSSNMIEYPQEKAAQLNADYQIEGQLKAQSDLSFEMKQAPIVTLAHWILASRQVLDDVPQLQSYINTRMIYGLRMKEDAEILAGDGAAGHINGLIRQASAYVPTDALYNTADNVRMMMAQIQAQFYQPSMVVLNPLDWAALQLTKSVNGEYLFGSPLAPVSPRLWNIDAAATYAMPQGNALVGDGRQAMVWDRQALTVEVSREDSDNFRRNMVTILVEERLGLSVFAQGAFAYGPISKAVTPPVTAKKSS